jgi:hypothetical protein
LILEVFVREARGIFYCNPKEAGFGWGSQTFLGMSLLLEWDSSLPPPHLSPALKQLETPPPPLDHMEKLAQWLFFY